ncbi:MAG: lytic transglycosylase domain-containing protein [Planctomycetota bacterium]
MVILIGALVYPDTTGRIAWRTAGDNKTFDLKKGDEAALDLLVKAVIEVESDGRRKLVGPKKERGLMQIRRRTWNWVCRTQLKTRWDYDRDAFDCEKNITVGRAYLVYLLESLDYDWPAAVMSYNCGLTNYRNGNIPTMTCQYLEKVKKTLNTKARPLST